MGEGEFKRVFEASPAIRRSEWAWVIAFSFLIWLLLTVVGFLVVELGRQVDLLGITPWWLLVGGAPLVVSLIVGYFFRRSRCRFILALTETQVRAGPLCIMYEDVDQISLDPHPFDVSKHSSPTTIEVTGGGKRICVQLGHPQRDECAELLRQKCRNAIIVHQSGQEFFPTAPTDKAKVARAALARFRKRAWGFIFAAIASGTLGALNLCGLSVGARKFVPALLAAVLFIVGMLIALQQAREYFKNSRRMKEALKELEKQNSEKLEP